MGILKFREKGFKKTTFGHLMCWPDFSWKALALPKQSLKVPKGMKKLKRVSERKATCPYMRVLRLGVLIAPSLDWRIVANMFQK